MPQTPTPELDRARKAHDPKQILEAVAAMVGERAFYWPAIDATGNLLEQRKLAEGLRYKVEGDPYLNADERQACLDALREI